MCDAPTFDAVLNIIAKIEYDMPENKDVDWAYQCSKDDVLSEMDKEVQMWIISHLNSFHNPYWNKELEIQWSIVKLIEKSGTSSKGSRSQKQLLREQFCVQRRIFGRMNRKFKRRTKKQQQLSSICNSNPCDF